MSIFHSYLLLTSNHSWHSRLQQCATNIAIRLFLCLARWHGVSETKDKQAQVAPTSLQLVRGLQLTEVTAILTLGMREPPNDTNCKVPLVMLTGKVAIHLQTNVQKKEEGKKEEEKKEEEKKDAADEMGSCGSGL